MSTSRINRAAEKQSERQPVTKNSQGNPNNKQIIRHRQVRLNKEILSIGELPYRCVLCLIYYKKSSLSRTVWKNYERTWQN